MRNSHSKIASTKEFLVATLLNHSHTILIGLVGFADGFMNENGAPQDMKLFHTPEVTAHYWKNDLRSDFSRVYKLANAGYKVIIGFCF